MIFMWLDDHEDQQVAKCREVDRKRRTALRR